MVAQAEFFDSGIDYITGVCTSRAGRVSLGAFASSVLANERRLGNEVCVWSMMGYEGQRCGPVQYGERHDSTVLRLSGYGAAEHWFECYQRSERITRLDVQVTIRVDQHPRKEVLRQYQSIKRRWRGRRDGPAITLWSSDDGGATVYVGHRSSNVYLRIYNKEAESKDPYFQRCVRFEGEFKARGARYALDNILAGSADRRRMTSFLHEIISDRGGLPPWASDGVRAQKGALRRDATTCSRKLQWLTNGVRPSVEFLIEHGMLEDAIAALGLRAFVTVNPVHGPQTDLNPKEDNDNAD